MYIYVTYVIMKTMCPQGYIHNGFVGTHTLGHMMYAYIYIYIYLYIFKYIYIYNKYIYIYIYIYTRVLLKFV